VIARTRWPLAVFVGYLTGRAAGHALAWGARLIDAHLARITDLGGET
jgi:hypothetical protein